MRFNKLSLIAALAAIGCAAHAQYHVVYLQLPDTGIGAQANAISGGKAAGFSQYTVVIPGKGGGTLTVTVQGAAWWPDQNAAPVLLDPLLLGSIAFAVSGNSVGGYLAGHATIWPNGVPNDYIDLNPSFPNTGGSFVYAMDPTSQGGSARIGIPVKGGGANDHPVVWFGSAASAVDLFTTVGGFTDGVVRGTAPGIQVGEMTTINPSFTQHAYLWHGTSDSAVDIHPAIATYSQANATDGTQHVGTMAIAPDFKSVAVLWNTDGSVATNLNPDNALGGSVATGCKNGKQVGWAYIASGTHAAAWSGSAATFVDLSQFVDIPTVSTFATGIDENGVISGYAQNAGNAGGLTPVLWVPDAVNVDRTPPTITSVSTSLNVIWPPNGKMIPVTVNYTLADNVDPNPTATLSITCNETTNAADFVVVDAHHVLLRANRAGTGTGRAYMITIGATDASGNTSSASIVVNVPHDLGH